jgi:hypothetical protein
MAEDVVANQLKAADLIRSAQEAIALTRENLATSRQLIQRAKMLLEFRRLSQDQLAVY